MTSVAVVGSFVQDFAFFTQSFPRPGETRIGNFKTGPGGKGFNQAIACYRQGVDTLFVGSVGNDLFAGAIKEFIHKEGLEVSLLEVEGSHTGAASIVVDGRAQNQIVVAPGANELLTCEHVEKALGSVAKLGVVLIQVEGNLDAAGRALQIGKSRGATTILNPAPINSGITTELFQHADIITPNETEFAFLAQHLLRRELSEDFWVGSEREIFNFCKQFPVPTVILTLGKRGCFVSNRNDDSYELVPAIKVTPVDTTGAGDAFSGGLAAGIVKFGGDLKKAVRFATVVAGLSTEKPGTTPSMPTKDEVAQRLSNS